ncbi:hypothetical protein F4703DRAFT_1790005 [Phycomyces blakesleeanus]
MSYEKQRAVTGLAILLLIQAFFCDQILSPRSLISCNLEESLFMVSAQFVNIRLVVKFYLTRLDHDKLYTMCEIGHLGFPSSLVQLLVFRNLKNLNILLLVCHFFWKSCKKSNMLNIIQQRSRSSVQLTDLVGLTDPMKDRN